MSSLRKKVFLYLLIPCLLLTPACSFGTAAEEKETLKIGYLPITHAAPLYIAKELEEELLHGVEVELIRFGTWIDLMDALQAGRIDGASVLIELAMKSREKGIDLKAVALGHKDGNAIVVSHDVHETEDLQGQTVAIPHTLSSHNILLYDMLKKDGLSYQDVNIVEMPPPEMPSSLAAGTIASYIVAEPFGAIGVTLDQGKVLYQSEEIWPHSLCCALVLRNDVIEAHPELVQSFINGYVKAGELAEEEEHVHSIHHEYLNVEEEALALSLEWISYEDFRIEEKDYDVLVDSLLEMELMDEPPLYEDFVDLTFLEEALAQ
ncbi:ABC transporter substrate-binding protein [Aliibacillus thermotolerans]|uniref:ABC transporter substrate-binding protein n=1 Tax=Aliibacillus thermotolerans TaxID=1834418 RepID=A0ABW0U8V6_9BACI|nr:ABC transporter substrate-binding protein [Aliibacillus thermotolerans]MDA3129008.1 metal ABC transporter substrate-binding protein [Aliibacillus thermotolerans]